MVSKEERAARGNTMGRKLLVERIQSDPDWTQAKLAVSLDCKQPSVSAWIRGETRPDTHFRQAIERLMGIPMGTWLTDAEVAIATGAPAPSSPALPTAADSSPALDEPDATGTEG